MPNAEVEEFGRSAGELVDNLHGDWHRVRSEDYPADTNNMECKYNRCNVIPLRFDDVGTNAHAPAKFGVLFVHDEQYALIDTPCKEVHRCTVPETTKSHRNEQVSIVEDFTLARTAEGNEQIISQPGGQTDVPTPPEVGNVFGQIRKVEVDRYFVSKQHRRTTRDIGVSREVEENLECKGICDQPHIQSREVFRM
jgi:hypothetical protein